jgi:hypothetical protein
LGTSMSPINGVIQGTLPDMPPHKLKLKEKLEKLLKLKQRGLLEEIGAMGPKELFDLSGMMSGICRFRPKGRKISERAKLFAMIRYQQEGWAIQKPQAWVDTVAREAERNWREHGAQRHQEAVANHYPEARAAAHGAFHRPGS